MSFFNTEKPKDSSAHPVVNLDEKATFPEKKDDHLDERTQQGAKQIFEELGKKFSELPFMKAVERAWTVVKGSIQDFFDQITAFFAEKLPILGKAENKEVKAESKEVKAESKEVKAENTKEIIVWPHKDTLKGPFSDEELREIVLDEWTPPAPLYNSAVVLVETFLGKLPTLKSRNACYRNSVNQMLEIPFFKKMVLEKQQQSSLSESLFTLWLGKYRPSSSEEEFSTQRLLDDENLLEALNESEKMSVVNGDLYEQQDASEYMTALLDELGFAIDIQVTKEKRTASAEVGSEKISSFFLPIRASIQEAFSDYCSEEISDSDITKKTSKIASSEPLDVIPFQIHRKLYNAELSRFEYSSANVDIPEVLDLAHLYGLEESALYELQGFVWYDLSRMARNGEASGHYIAYVKRGDTWYECNDSLIRQIHPQDKVFQKRKEQLGLGLYVKVSENPIQITA